MPEYVPFSPPREFHETEIVYRSVDPWAVGGLVLGLLSPFSLVDTPGWLVPILGIAVNGIALLRIRPETGRTGRWLALAGLFLSTLFITAPVAERVTSQWIVAPQGRPIVEKWFELLRDQHPEQALTLTFRPQHRPANDETLWFSFRHDEDAKKRLLEFVKKPLVRTLMALGDRAQVRYYSTDQVVARDEKAWAAYYYTVTFDDADGQKKTFFVRMVAARQPTQPWLNPWNIENFEEGGRPRGY